MAEGFSYGDPHEPVATDITRVETTAEPLSPEDLLLARIETEVFKQNLGPQAKDLLKTALTQGMDHTVNDLLQSLVSKYEPGNTIRESLPDLHGLHPNDWIQFYGFVFEQLALGMVPDTVRPYPELETFLLNAMKSPFLWNIAIDNPEDVSKDYAEYLPLRTNDWRPKSQNDAIALKIVEDDHGSSQVVITGLIEAKSSKLDDTRVIEQKNKAPEDLYSVVQKYKKVFPLLVERLGLHEYGVPRDIDCLPPEELSYTIIQPQNRLPPKTLAEYNGVEILHMPFTTRDIHEIAGWYVDNAFQQV